MTNREIAAALREVADRLEERGENVYKVQAYRRGGRTVAEHEGPIEALLRRDGPEALKALPAIGESLAAAIVELTSTGRLELLETLRADAEATAAGDAEEEGDDLPF